MHGNDIKSFVSPTTGASLSLSGGELVSATGERFGISPSGIPLLLVSGIAMEEEAHYASVADHGYGGAQEVVNDREFIAMLLEATKQRFDMPGLGSGEASSRWLDATYDVLAQERCYEFVGDVRGLSVLQIGGKGFHAAKSIIAGAREAWLVTPVEAEARYFLETAELTKGSHSSCALHVAVGVGERLPLPDGSVDRVIVGGSLHHMDVPGALRECRRVLQPGGRFAAWDPWRSDLYDVGIRLFGKREPGVNCRPLDWSRMGVLSDDVTVHLYSPVVRYLLLVASKCGVSLSLPMALSMFRLEDRLSRRMWRGDRLRSSAAILMEVPN